MFSYTEYGHTNKERTEVPTSAKILVDSESGNAEKPRITGNIYDTTRYTSITFLAKGI